jgi:hypothetical protein
MRRRWIRAGFVATAVAAMLLIAQGAYASTPLPDGSVVNARIAPVIYTFSTTTHYWSVIGVATTVDYDLALLDSSGNQLAASNYGTGVTDFIAINNNLRPLGSYSASVTHYSGTGSFWVQQVQGHSVTTLPASANDGVSGPGDPDLAFSAVNSNNVVSVSDIYLTAGQKFWVNDPTTGVNFFLLESNPADSTTFIRTRAQATNIAGTRVAQGCTLYTANYTGWHGWVEVNPQQPYATNPQEGTANAIVAYDPARPNTCPQRNFPSPTPPGP